MRYLMTTSWYARFDVDVAGAPFEGVKDGGVDRV